MLDLIYHIPLNFLKIMFFAFKRTILQNICDIIAIITQRY